MPFLATYAARVRADFQRARHVVIMEERKRLRKKAAKEKAEMFSQFKGYFMWGRDNLPFKKSI